MHDPGMAALFTNLTISMRHTFRTRAELALENLAPRQELANLRHTSRRPRFPLADRAFCIRCTDPVFQISADDGILAAWERRHFQLDGDCSCGAGGIVRGPTSLASSTGSRRVRVWDQYLGASSM